MLRPYPVTSAHPGAANQRSLIMAERDNVEIVKNAYAAFARGDVSAVVNACAPEVEWIIPGASGVPVAGIRRGREGVSEFFRTLSEHQAAEQFEPREYVASGDKVVALGHYRWHITRTRKTFEADWAHVFTIRNGSVVRFQEYADTAAEAEAYR
jgi:ketosteroid isomerase-like protein